MALGERIRQLRSEQRWSQAELGDKVGVDSQRISRYENERITPTVDVVVRIAEAFNVSIDYLLIDDAPRRPLHGSADEILGDRLHQLTQLDHDDRTAVLDVIDAYVTRNRLRTITTQAG